MGKGFWRARSDPARVVCRGLQSKHGPRCQGQGARGEGRGARQTSGLGMSQQQGIGAAEFRLGNIINRERNCRKKIDKRDVSTWGMRRLSLSRRGADLETAAFRSAYFGGTGLWLFQPCRRCAYGFWATQLRRKTCLGPTRTKCSHWTAYLQRQGIQAPIADHLRRVRWHLSWWGPS